VALTPGTRLGPFEISNPIGAGGMGEVYAATDVNLARQVAIKVLPEALAADADRLARFDREAKTLASLNHPNIALIFGIERAGGTTALVMELVDGTTLADRITDGAIPIDEALPIARQIAEALEAAHEQGIIHRDLKPANVKVRPDGRVKVLDFGLAKAIETSTGVPGALSRSPTITTPAMTQAGVIPDSWLFRFELVRVVPRSNQVQPSPSSGPRCMGRHNPTPPCFRSTAFHLMDSGSS
jgi:serine/threonine protein kinase